MLEKVATRPQKSFHAEVALETIRILRFLDHPKSKANPKVKGSGQECPLHTSRPLERHYLMVPPTVRSIGPKPAEYGELFNTVSTPLLGLMP
jgi:hypothetical protein